MTRMANFISTMSRVSQEQSNPMMQKWLYGLTKLNEMVAEKIIGFCLYQDLIPDDLLLSYSRILSDILSSDEKLWVDSKENRKYLPVDVIAGIKETIRRLDTQECDDCDEVALCLQSNVEELEPE